VHVRTSQGPQIHLGPQGVNVRRHKGYFFSTWRTYEACYYVPNQNTRKCQELDAGHLKMDKCELNCLPMQSVH